MKDLAYNKFTIQTRLLHLEWQNPQKKEQEDQKEREEEKKLTLINSDSILSNNSSDLVPPHLWILW